MTAHGGDAKGGSRAWREAIPTGDSRILLVVLKELPSTKLPVEDVFWIFSQFGRVEKLSSFARNAKSQILVQYSSPEEAQLTLLYLNGRTLQIVTRGRTVSFQFAILPSKLKELNFKSEDSRNRDYAPVNAELEQFLSAYMTPQSLETWKAKGMLDFLWGRNIGPTGWLVPRQGDADCGRIPIDLSEAKGLKEGKVGDCVHIAGLVAEKDGTDQRMTAKQLFRFAGTYGTVVAVKLLQKFPGRALVQYSCKEEADSAIANLNGAQIFGRTVEVETSKNANAMHWSGADTELQQRMCTYNDIPSPPPPTADLRIPPSSTVGMYIPGVDGSVARTLMMQKLGPLDAKDFTVSGEGHATACFRSVEDAVMAISQKNGEEQVLADGTKVNICLYFAENLPKNASSDLPLQQTVTDIIGNTETDEFGEYECDFDGLPAAWTEGLPEKEPADDDFRACTEGILYKTTYSTLAADSSA